MKTKIEHIEESIRFRRRQIAALLNNINYNCDMLIQAETMLGRLYEEARIASIVNLCLTGK
jgi:hypothetical protein